MMHQCKAIYGMMYGGFMQVFQMVIGAKQITSSPIKEQYQDHERFMIKLHKACMQFCFCCFLRSVFADDVTMRPGDTRVNFLNRIEASLNKLVEEWERSPHEPTRVVCLCLKYTSAFFCCKNGIRNLDFWVLEKESCVWMAAWKRCQKSMYLQEQCE